MSGSDGGVVTRLRGADLAAVLEGLAGGGAGDDVSLDIKDMRAVPSADLSFDDLLDVVDAAAEAVAGGATGVVLTQGTDTLEETAYLVDLVWPHDAPFIVTGAMRNPTLPGADGPANVVASVRVATSSVSRDRGVLVVFNDEIHAAALVRKSHSTSPATFISPDLGPVGHVVEGTPRFLASPVRHRPVDVVRREALASTRIALYTALFDDDARSLDGIAATCQGLVVAGFGAGHVSSGLAATLGDLAARIPVVLTSRTGAGSVLSNTYGAVGSERDLRERGLINGGFLHPYKARILLRLLVAADVDSDGVHAAFADRG